MRSLIVLVAALAVGSLGPPATLATRGVALDIGAIAISDPLFGGREYTLPAIGVRNPGTEPSAYAMGVSAMTDAVAPEVDWFVFDPPQLSLEPGETKDVSVRLLVPEGARPASYEGLLTAQLVTEQGGPRVGAAAAARVTFTVHPHDFLQEIGIAISDLISAFWPWSVIAPITAATLLMTAIAVRLLLRRFAFRLERRA